MLVNACLAVAKFVAGMVGHTYALVADAIESAADIFASLIVWGGLRIADRDPDEHYPFGYGKAETLATAVVGLMLLAAATGIGVQAIREIRTPHLAPAPWTLGVLVVVVAVKALVSHRVRAVGAAIGGTAVRADASHHLSDAVTSAAAFVGISIALVGGPGWESADDWAALAAAGVVAYNGATMLRRALRDLMDRSATAEIVGQVRQAARTVPGVMAVEKLGIRTVGLGHRVIIHVQAEPTMSLDEAHQLSGRVKGAIREAVKSVQSVLVHMEPYLGPPAGGSAGAG